MRTEKVLVLSVAEAKEALETFYIDMLSGDKNLLLEYIHTGDCPCPKLNLLSAKQIAEHYVELGIADTTLAMQHPDVTQIQVQIGDYDYVTVWDVEDRHPTERMPGHPNYVAPTALMASVGQ